MRGQQGSHSLLTFFVEMPERSGWHEQPPSRQGCFGLVSALIGAEGLRGCVLIPFMPTLQRARRSGADAPGTEGPTTASKRPKGEGAPQGGAGRGRAAERGQPPHDRRRAERRKPDPQGRAGRRTPNQTKRLSFVRLAGDRAHGQLLTKLAFCWVRPDVAAAELWRRTATVRFRSKKFRKAGEGGVSLGGYYDTPLGERLVTTLVFWT